MMSHHTRQMSSKKRLRFLLFQVIDPHYHRADAISNMKEIMALVETFGGDIIVKDVQHKVQPHIATYIGPGKIEALKQIIIEKQIDVIVLNDLVNSGKLFRLEKSFWPVNPRIRVWDKIDLILNIFDKHADSAEAKLQIELARIEHDGPRIYGLGKDALSRQGGGIGTRGLGETNIEKERRLIKSRQAKIKKQLKKINLQKQQSIKRRTSQGLGPVALVGYTSAGKTSLFNALTGKDKQTSQGLFTTLDTVVGKMKTDESQESVVISDTIGFIQNLPPVLIQAFRSTLLESLEAKLILHVVDGSDENYLNKVAVVEEILFDLGATQKQILVVNKVDKLSDEQKKEIKSFFDNRDYKFASAYTGQGLEDLKLDILENLNRNHLEELRI